MPVLDEAVSPLINQGQSPAMILMNHPELGVSEKTIYNYIDKGIFEGRTYKDFQELLKNHPDTNVVEMDTVVGCDG